MYSSHAVEPEAHSDEASKPQPSPAARKAAKKIAPSSQMKIVLRPGARERMLLAVWTEMTGLPADEIARTALLSFLKMNEPKIEEYLEQKTELARAAAARILGTADHGA